MSKHILICDDDEGILEIVKIILTDQNYEITALSNSDKVIDEVKSGKPDLVLLDLWMPGIGGDELTRQLKNDTETETIPVVISSASKDTAEIAKDIGADGFILKPFDIEDLEKMVAKHLKKVTPL